MNEGIKIGQKAKGFRFASASGVLYAEEMEKMAGKTGTITAIYEDRFTITFDDDLCRNPYASPHGQGFIARWTYPIKEYLEMRREERLKELGI